MPKSNTIILTLLYIFFSEHFLRLAFIHSFHPFILYLPYIQNFTLQGAKTRKKLPDAVKHLSATIITNPNMIPRLSGHFSLFGLQNHTVLSLQPRGGGGGGVLRISSDRDDRMGAKIKTQKYP